MKLMINDHGTIVFYIKIPHPSFSTLEIPFSLHNPILIHSIFFTQSPSHSFYFTVLFYNDEKTCGKIVILTLISDQTKFSVFFS